MRSVEEVKKTVGDCFSGLEADFCNEDIQKRVIRYGKYLNLHADYEGKLFKVCSSDVILFVNFTLLTVLTFWTTYARQILWRSTHKACRGICVGVSDL